ncbi:hypothetical protein KK083_05955 [Fulvivirgaceae bacterium PWU4]|uniref:Alpha/beta hydrolase n=1 Tax=Chryseosolibacter histidini TaxID=2782349 RepID=A0AAP2DHH2_9BACT|nr:alpha/beta hydrolase-fold protein [Chryseosolibacter histidini]MBT1696410.1 hypothetical protein [Chryseosolibacter histidini]
MVHIKLRQYLYRLCLFVVFLNVAQQGRGQSEETILRKEHTLYSEILSEKRSFFITLPASYEHDEFYGGKRYPVMVLLDADTHFEYASGMVHFMSDGSNEQIPEMIVVAVRNTNRTRDMTSGLANKTDHFLDFLVKELLPYIDQHYRTAPYRVLVGHSLAGLFALNCFLDQNKFNACIAIDPTLRWNNDFILKKADSVLKGNLSFRGRLYLSQASNPFEPGQHAGTRGKAFDTFREALANSRSQQVFYRYAYYEDETHFSVPFESLRDGLLSVFENYQFPFQIFFANGSNGVIRHYQKLFDQWQVDLLPPGKVIHQVGLFLLNNEKQVDKAIDLLQMDAIYYPNSPAIHSSLGQAYQAKGDKAMALESYRKVLRLRASDEQARKAIQELNGQE